MNESNLTKISLNVQTKFRLNEMNKIKDYFYSEIQERKTMSEKLDKYVAAFDFTAKILTVLSATFGTLSDVSHATVVGIPDGLAGASLTVVFPLTTGIVKKSLSVTRRKKKKHNKIVMLAKIKLNSIETLMSQAFIDLDISHEEFKTIVIEKEKFEIMKGSIKNTKSKDELSENSRALKKLVEIHKLKRKIFFFCYI